MQAPPEAMASDSSEESKTGYLKKCEESISSGHNDSDAAMTESESLILMLGNQNTRDGNDPVQQAQGKLNATYGKFC